MESQTVVDYAAVLHDLKKRRDDLDKAISGIEQLMGLPVSTVANGDMSSPVSMLAPGDTNISSDAFFGMNIAKAAQKYLSMRKKPATPTEIAAAFEQGGFPHQSAN